MWLFRKKKEKEKEPEKPLEIPVPPHTHTWKDMPWYMEVLYNGNDKWASYSIIEPYICVTCGERNDKVLEKETWRNISVEEREKEYAAARKRYKKYLKPRAVVEDMINNILLVKDPQYLDMVEEMRGTPHRRCGTSAEMNQVKKDNHYRIEVKNK